MNNNNKINVDNVLSSEVPEEKLDVSESSEVPQEKLHVLEDSKKGEPKDESNILEECAICCQTLAIEPVVILQNGTIRACEHFFHGACARNIENFGLHKCPSCRSSFDGMSEVPNILEYPKEWFNLFDIENLGSLSSQQILSALPSSLLINHAKLEADLPGEFQRWDTDGDGRLSFHEMMGDDGLVEFARGFLPRNADYSNMPDIIEQKRAWFLFWDRDGNGCLDEAEVVRALIKTFTRDSTRETILEILENIIRPLWKELDPNLNGSIDADEFVKCDGLFEFIKANLQLFK